jgi:hypothetical protein
MNFELPFSRKIIAEHILLRGDYRQSDMPHKNIGYFLGDVAPACPEMSA